MTHDTSTHVATRGEGPLPERFENPGLPPHRHRMGDTDPKAAKRAERQVAALFLVSIVGTLLTLFAYFYFQLDKSLPFVDYVGRVGKSNLFLGLGLFLALFGIGAGAIHWAKTLMPDEERVEYRHLQRGSDEDREDAVRILKEGAGEAGLGRRPLLRGTLIAALGLVGLPAIVLMRDLGPLPGNDLATTFWKKGTYLVRDPEGGRIKATDMTLNSIAHIMPEGVDQTPDPQEQRAKAAALLMRLLPEQLGEKSKPGAYEGIICYSKICTHMGCPVALWEQTTHHLLCPCHQSTFDVEHDCKVIFGPAKRPLPQLPITVDSEGYLYAKSGFDQPVGPSYWERG